MSDLPPTPTLPPIAPLEEAGPDYIGVPSGDFRATRTFQGEEGFERRGPDGRLQYQPGRPSTRSVDVKPRFVEGAELSYYSMPPDQIARIQAQLVQAGLLDPDGYQPGFIGGATNDPTIAGLRTVMSFANRAGYSSVTAALQAYIASGYGDLVREQGGEQERLPAPVSNADDLRRVFKAAVIDTLGQGWSQDQIDAMVDNYQAAERAFNAAAAAGEAIDQQVATPETFAVNAAKAADPLGAQSAEFLDVGNQLMSMLGGWSPVQ